MGGSDPLFQVGLRPPVDRTKELEEMYRQHGAAPMINESMADGVPSHMIARKMKKKKKKYRRAPGAVRMSMEDDIEDEPDYSGAIGDGGIEWNVDYKPKRNYEVPYSPRGDASNLSPNEFR